MSTARSFKANPNNSSRSHSHGTERHLCSGLRAELGFNDDDPPMGRDEIHEVRVSLRSPGLGACALAADATVSTQKA